MGKASSSKKVARAARAGGSVRPNQRRLTFPIAVAAIVIIGIGLVVFARSEFTEGTASAEAPGTDDHWHAAYGFYICNTFGPPLQDAKADTTGIHTHGDGVVHIHPFTSSHGGRNATLGKWGEIVGVDFGSDSITMPDGTTYENGFDCDGQPATVKVYVWPADDPDAEPVIYDSDFGSIRFTEDRQAITIAVVPDGAEVPRPNSVPTLDNLTDLPSANEGLTPSSTIVTPSSIAGEPSEPDTSVAPASP